MEVIGSPTRDLDAKDLVGTVLQILGNIAGIDADLNTSITAHLSSLELMRFLIEVEKALGLKLNLDTIDPLDLSSVREFTSALVNSEAWNHKR